MLSRISSIRQLASKRRNKKHSNRGLNLETLERRVVFSGDAFVAGAASADAAEIGNEQPERRIVNGQQTSQFPSVGIVNDGCTGTLISPTHVLTAAHCTVGVSDSAGTFEVGGQTYRTSDIADHPRYNDNRFDAGYDLSVMELSRPVTGVVPSQINRVAPQVGTTLTLVGFGEGGTSRNGSLGDFGTKRVGETPLDEVTNLHINWRFDSHSESNTAPGDSGGPAFINVDGNFLVAGVTSGGDGDAHTLGDNSFDTRVDVFANWIDSIVADTAPSPDPTPNPDPVPDPTPDPDPGPIDGDDHADRPGAAATDLVLADNFGEESGYVDADGDRDAFRIDVEEDSELTIAATSIDGFLDTYLRVYDEDGELIAENDDFGDSFDSQVSIDVGTGTYFFTVGSYADEGEGGFSATVEANPEISDVGDGDEFFPDAIFVDVDEDGRTRENGVIGRPGEEVVFAYEAIDEGDLIIRAQDRRSGLDTTLTVYNSNGNEIDYNDDFRFSTNSRIRIDGVAGETYYIVVGGYEDSTGDFRLRVIQRQASRGSDFAASRQDAVDRFFARGSQVFMA